MSAYMLMGGVATSRLGLWMFDLAVIQQMQVTSISHQNFAEALETYPELSSDDMIRGVTSIFVFHFLNLFVG